jgi:hypothetical protein
MVTKHNKNPITKVISKTGSRSTNKSKPITKQVTKRTPSITLNKTLSKDKGPVKMTKNKSNLNITGKPKSTLNKKVITPAKKTNPNIQKSIPPRRRTPTTESIKTRIPLTIVENKKHFTKSYQPEPVIVQPNNRSRFLLTPITQRNNKLVYEMKKYPEPIREPKPVKSKEVNKKPSTIVKKIVTPAKVGGNKIVKMIPKPLPTPSPGELPITYSQNTTFIAEMIRLCEKHNVENGDIKLWEQIFSNIKLVDNNAEILKEFCNNPEIALTKINKITAVPPKLLLQELLALNKYDRIMLQAKYTHKYLTWEDLNNFIINNGDDPIQFIINQFLINNK